MTADRALAKLLGCEPQSQWLCISSLAPGYAAKRAARPLDRRLRAFLVLRGSGGGTRLAGRADQLVDRAAFTGAASRKSSRISTQPPSRRGSREAGCDGGRPRCRSCGGISITQASRSDFGHHPSCRAVHLFDATSPGERGKLGTLRGLQKFAVPSATEVVLWRDSMTPSSMAQLPRGRSRNMSLQGPKRNLSILESESRVAPGSTAP